MRGTPAPAAPPGRWRIVSRKVPGELGRHVPCCCGVDRQIVQHGLRLRFAALRIGLAQQFAAAGLVDDPCKPEAGTPVPASTAGAPSRRQSQPVIARASSVTSPWL